MKSLPLSALSLLLLSLLLTACGGEDGNDGDYSNMTEQQMNGTMELTNDDIDNYIAAVKEIRATGAAVDANPTMSSAWGATGKMNDIMKKHGMSQNQFVAIQMAIVKAQMAKATKSIDMPKSNQAVMDQLTNTPGIEPGAVAEMRKKMEDAQTVANKQVEGVPDANIELVSQRLADIERAMKSEK